MIETLTVILNELRNQGKEPASVSLPYPLYIRLFDELKAQAEFVEFAGVKAEDPTPVNFWFGDTVVYCGSQAFLVEFQ